MNVLGHSTGTSLAVQHVSGQPGRLAATLQPNPVGWDGWLQNPDPVNRISSGGVLDRTIAIRPACYRAFLYKCAWHDGSTWHLPAITQALKIGGTSPVTSADRPYETHAWGDAIGVPGIHGDALSWGDSRWNMDGTSLLDFSSGLNGDNIFRLAEEGGVCLDHQIPPYSHHDLFIVALQYVVFLHSGLYDVKIGAANQKAWIRACVCRVDAQEGGES